MTEERPLWESLWLEMTIVAYHKSVLQGHDHMRYRYAKEIAQSLLENIPNSAHLYVLERLHTNGENLYLWKDVLAELDEQEALNAIGREVGEHISRREGEPHEAQQELRDADDGNTWKPSAPNSVDESAP
jgi:hypothetical protein